MKNAIAEANDRKVNEDASKIVPQMAAISLSTILEAYGFKGLRPEITESNDPGSIILKLNHLEAEISWAAGEFTVKAKTADSNDSVEKTWTMQDVKKDGFDEVIHSAVSLLNEVSGSLNGASNIKINCDLANDDPIRMKLEPLVKDDHEAFDYLDYDFYDWYAKDFLPSLDYHRDWSDDYDCWTTDDDTSVKTITVYGSENGKVSEIIFSVDDDEWFDAVVYSLHDLDISLPWSMIPSRFILKHAKALKPIVMADADRLGVYETGVYNNDGMVADEANAHFDPYYGVDVDSLPGGADYD